MHFQGQGAVVSLKRVTERLSKLASNFIEASKNFAIDFFNIKTF
jgi:hypothetical protein